MLEGEHVQQIKENGFTVIPNAFGESTITKLKQEFDEAVEKNHCKKDEHYTVITDPLLSCPAIVDVATHDTIFTTVSEFFGCVPSIGTLNFRQSHVNKSEPVTTQLFHCDQNSLSFIKCFIYLNNVVDAEDGPLTIVPESLRKKPTNWSSKYRWAEEEMTAIYGSDCLSYLTASAGDLIIARATTAFHRGTPPTRQDRTMLTLNYVVHPEDWKPVNFKMKMDDLERLEDRKKPLTDFLIKVRK